MAWAKGRSGAREKKESPGPSLPLLPPPTNSAPLPARGTARHVTRETGPAWFVEGASGPRHLFWAAGRGNPRFPPASPSPPSPSFPPAPPSPPPVPAPSAPPTAPSPPSPHAGGRRGPTGPGQADGGGGPGQAALLDAEGRHWSSRWGRGGERRRRQAMARKAGRDGLGPGIAGGVWWLETFDLGFAWRTGAEEGGLSFFKASRNLIIAYGAALWFAVSGFH